MSNSFRKAMFLLAFVAFVCSVCFLVNRDYKLGNWPSENALSLNESSMFDTGTRVYFVPKNTYFVSPGGIDANPGTQALPKMTIQAAMADANEGDTVMVGAGTFAGPITLAGKGLSIIGSPGGKSIIKISKVEDGRVFELNRSDTLVGKFFIKDLTLKYPEKNQFSANGHISDTW